MKAGVNLERRNALKTGGGLGLLAVVGLIPGVASADWLKAAFEARTMGVPITENSSAIQITTPEIAENGAVVPVDSSLSRTGQVSILADKNPAMLAASFDIEAGNLAPDWYITDIRAHYNGKIISDGRFGSAILKILSGISLHGRSGGRQNRVLLTGQSGRYAFRRGGNKLRPLIFALSWKCGRPVFSQ